MSKDSTSKNISFKIGDITKECVDAVVNAANSSLMGGGGVDGAIHAAGGSQIIKECKKIRDSRYPDGLPQGEAVSTSGGELCAKYVIHTVGPIYPTCKTNCEEILSNCYKNSIKEAKRLKCKSISFPAISTGIYGYPKEEAAKIAYTTISETLKESDNMEVVFVFHSKADRDIFLQNIKRHDNETL